jgi:hypothetical protein
MFLVPILLQKSAAADGRSAVLLRAAGFDPPALTSFKPSLRNAQSPSGWWPRDHRSTGALRPGYPILGLQRVPVALKLTAAEKLMAGVLLQRSAKALSFTWPTSSKGPKLRTLPR